MTDRQLLPAQLATFCVTAVFYIPILFVLLYPTLFMWQSLELYSLYFLRKKRKETPSMVFFLSKLFLFKL